MKDAKERQKNVGLWLVKMLTSRLKDPTQIPPKRVYKASVLIDGYIMKHRPSEEKINGFMDGILLSLIVFNTPPTNVKGVRDEADVG